MNKELTKFLGWDYNLPKDFLLKEEAIFLKDAKSENKEIVFWKISTFEDDFLLISVCYYDKNTNEVELIDFDYNGEKVW